MNVQKRSGILFASTLGLLGLLWWVGGGTTNAQQASQQGRPAAPPGGIEPLAIGDTTRFTPIFDGQTLRDWDGDPDFWRVEGGAIVGQTTAERPLRSNTFLIWRGGQPANFELKLDYRIDGTNSGVQYRSVEVPTIGKWVLKGYQADIDFQNTYTGQLYEERGRGFLAMRGQLTWLQPGRKQLLALLRSGDDLKGQIRIGDWNTMHILAHGNRLTHLLNGHLMAETIDDDGSARAAAGLIGFQIHTGPPMKVEFRNIWLKTLANP